MQSFSLPDNLKKQEEINNNKKQEDDRSQAPNRSEPTMKPSFFTTDVPWIIVHVYRPTDMYIIMLIHRHHAKVIITISNQKNAYRRIYSDITGLVLVIIIIIFIGLPGVKPTPTTRNDKNKYIVNPKF